MTTTHQRRRSTDLDSQEDVRRMVAALQCRNAELESRLTASALGPLPDVLAHREQYLRVLVPLRESVGKEPKFDATTRAVCLAAIDQVIAAVERIA